MACFLVSAVAAAGTTVAKHIIKKNEKKEKKELDNTKFGSDTKWSEKLKYLELTLWSGSFMLAGEHIIHGEVVPFPPFLTAASSPESTVEMLNEMGTVGVAMLITLVLVWAIFVFIWDFLKFKKRQSKSIEAKV